MKNNADILYYIILSITLTLSFMIEDIISSELLSALVIITSLKILSLNHSNTNK